MKVNLRLNSTNKPRQDKGFCQEDKAHYSSSEGTPRTLIREKILYSVSIIAIHERIITVSRLINGQIAK
uniref:Uncharacterized protein n=1 Tax=Octopus bimaculoides TaxID=37653 RepID=A0A0L8GYB0_OCTBM